mmetsp:Transcript_7350/g.13223  ORF Transcript_7350/g.13223 Transcript_7350/m.13223 type:complete len:167 (-) Transcript_7350:177-677(-)
MANAMGRSVDDCIVILEDSVALLPPVEGCSEARRKRALGELAPTLLRNHSNKRQIWRSQSKSVAPVPDDPLQESPSTPHEDTDKKEHVASNTTANNTPQQRRAEDLKKEIQQVKAESEAMEQKTKDMFQKQANLWNVYEYGLDLISKLNDLRDAPDNVLPGNDVTL